MIRYLVNRVRKHSREKRKKIFLENFSISRTTKILDLGSEDGSNVYSLLRGMDYNPENVYVADIAEGPIKKANENYGFIPILLEDSSKNLPFDEGYFDIVYCSSVIEHVTVRKELVWSLDQEEFAREAVKRQAEFVSEIRRIGKGYFVQTPNKYFPIETHTWFPFVGPMPRGLQIRLIKNLNKFWIKRTSPDFYLLDRKGFSKLFPDASILEERSLGIVKSWIAVKR